MFAVVFPNSFLDIHFHTHSHPRTKLGSDAVGLPRFRNRRQLVFRSHVAASGGTPVSKAGVEGLGWGRHPHHNRRPDEFPTAGMDARM